MFVRLLRFLLVFFVVAILIMALMLGRSIFVLTILFLIPMLISGFAFPLHFVFTFCYFLGIILVTLDFLVFFVVAEQVTILMLGRSISISIIRYLILMSLSGFAFPFIFNYFGILLVLNYPFIFFVVAILIILLMLGRLCFTSIILLLILMLISGFAFPLCLGLILVRFFLITIFLSSSWWQY